jgi:hypothetical protein
MKRDRRAVVEVLFSSVEIPEAPRWVCTLGVNLPTSQPHRLSRTRALGRRLPANSV